MIDISYSDLSLNGSGMVYFKTRALRPCIYAGQTLLAIGDSSDVSFFDAEALIRALHGNANLFDLPLPPSVPLLILDEFDAHAQTFMREYMLGAEREYLKTLVPAGQPVLIIDKAASLGLIVQKPSMLRVLEAEVREKTQADLRDRLLVEKSHDLGKDFMVKPADESEPVQIGVVHRVNPDTFERISRNAGGYAPQASRIRWPFNTMRIGDGIFLDAKLARRGQTAVHVYAARTNKRFSTSMNRVTKVLHVIRLEDRPE
jgi:hypothetical protein